MVPLLQSLANEVVVRAELQGEPGLSRRLRVVLTEVRNSVEAEFRTCYGGGVIASQQPEIQPAQPRFPGLPL